MPRIFISYRRADSAEVTKRIYNELIKVFGKENIFRDVDDIPVGTNFREVINNELASAEVLLVIIGQSWLEILQDRATELDDFVRIEIEVGLKLPYLQIIPVLLNGTKMPLPNELQESIRPLTIWNGVKIGSYPNFKKDIQDLIDKIKSDYTLKTSIYQRLPQKLKFIVLIIAVVTIGILLLFLSPPIFNNTNVPNTFENDDWTPVSREFGNVEMVLVPNENFKMGSTEDQIESAIKICQMTAYAATQCKTIFFVDETEVHIQQFLTPFWIDKTEVTRAMFQICIDEGPCTKTPNSDFSTTDDQPINRVTWFQAEQYCEWRDARLPTEAEWEYAARGPDGWVFPWGNEWNGNYANHCDKKCGNERWFNPKNYKANKNSDDGFAIIAPVGSFPDGASWVGALDMSGNVWEWTSSVYRHYPYENSNDGVLPGDDNTTRVLRGGSFDFPPHDMRSANRLVTLPTTENDLNGFRCVRDYDE